MKLSGASTLPEVAIAVGEQLARHGIRAVLTGGACVAIYTRAYTSKDADFVLQGRVTQPALDAAMKELGFERDGDRFVHPEIEFSVEFPPGPLSIGDDLSIEPEWVSLGGLSALALSPTDSCRDRLAAFYHWDDRQALRLAVEIARTQEVDVGKIREWSAGEGMTVKCEEFVAELTHGHTRGRRRRR